MANLPNKLFYYLKPVMPRKMQLFLRRLIARYKRKKYAHIWPIDPHAATPPAGWKGWPDGKQFALVIMHDVDTQIGHDKCSKLMDLEEGLGMRSTFNVVPERYKVSGQLLKDIKSRGFGLGVHGLNHDGKLFLTYDGFRKKAAKINEYIKSWDAKGFSSPSMHHRLEWMHHLDIESSTSTFDTDPFEPQSDAIGTIFPFIVQNDPAREGFVEMPYTLPQDFTLYIILHEKNIDIMKTKLDWIVKNKGMALFNTHPDYMDFSDGKQRRYEEYPVSLYKEFLLYIKNSYAGNYWDALPHDMAIYLKSNGNSSITFKAKGK
jgi:hypothetical protein